MNIFILEDDIVRIAWFKKEFKQDTLTINTDAEPAKKILKKQKFDLIFLDHDLGGEVYVSSDNANTGYGGFLINNITKAMNGEFNYISNIKDEKYVTEFTFKFPLIIE